MNLTYLIKQGSLNTVEVDLRISGNSWIGMFDNAVSSFLLPVDLWVKENKLGRKIARNSWRLHNKKFVTAFLLNWDEKTVEFAI
jgi:hypothetical protein